MMVNPSMLYARKLGTWLRDCPQSTNSDSHKSLFQQSSTAEQKKKKWLGILQLRGGPKYDTQELGDLGEDSSVSVHFDVGDSDFRH